MANTTDYKALYEALEQKIYGFTKDEEFHPKYVMRNVSECSAYGVLDFILKEYKKQEEKITDLEEVMEDLYDEDGAVAERERFGLVLVEEFYKVKEENDKLKDEAGDYESMRKHRDTLLEESEERFMKIHNLEDELNKVMEDMTKLKEKTEKLQKAFDDKEHWGLTMVAYMDACDEWGRFDDFVAEGGFDEDDMKHEWVQEWIKNTTEEESEDEEEEDKYDGDDWGWVYGKNIVEREEYKEVVLIMAGGGDHWENWTITPTMNYIVNKDGKHPQHGKVLVQSSCGKYVSFQDEDYECDEDEGICEYELCVEC